MLMIFVVDTLNININAMAMLKFPASGSAFFRAHSLLLVCHYCCVEFDH